jgi:hypothetical protein
LGRSLLAITSGDHFGSDRGVESRRGRRVGKATGCDGYEIV